MTLAFYPVLDRSGRFSPLKAAVLAGLCLPAVVLAIDAWTGSLGAEPLDTAIHAAGDWAIRFLFLSLAVTPLRRFWHWSRLLLVRRMVGLAALGYALAHLILYVADQKWDLVVAGTEIVLRYYLLIGFVALAGLAVLGATSTDAALRRLGRRWKPLHKAVYVLAVLAVVHFFLQSKINVDEPVLMAGLLLLLFFYRLANARGGAWSSTLGLAATALAAALATMALEYAWYALFTGVPAHRVLAANLDFTYTIRPMWWVLTTGVAVAALAGLRSIRVRVDRARSTLAA